MVKQGVHKFETKNTVTAKAVISSHFEVLETAKAMVIGTLQNKIMFTEIM